MYLSLVSDDKKSFVKFDFTKFFSEKGYWTFWNGKTIFVKRYVSHYKQMIRNLVEKYISEEKMQELGIYSPEKVVDYWFKQALNEKLKAHQRKFLEKNYQMFKQMYKLEDFKNA